MNPKHLRTLLAIFAGVLMATGRTGLEYLDGRLNGPQVFVGLIFGCAIAGSMLHDPERVTQRSALIIQAVLLGLLIAWAVWKDSPEALAFTASWVTLFGGTLFAFVKAHRKCVAERE
ncbi:MAG: hypothetical protein ABIS50_18190 [Luteolibacter sp.]|uniref:hypothetical protein n=1 Tax=Luteolibacter sp. TaxID=1962973 RepID=UPI003262F72C